MGIEPLASSGLTIRSCSRRTSGPRANPVPVYPAMGHSVVPAPFRPGGLWFSDHRLCTDLRLPAVRLYYPGGCVPCLPPFNAIPFLSLGAALLASGCAWLLVVGWKRRAAVSR